MSAQYFRSQLFQRWQNDARLQRATRIEIGFGRCCDGQSQQCDGICILKLGAPKGKLGPCQLCLCTCQFKPSLFSDADFYSDAPLQILYKVQVFLRMGNLHTPPESVIESTRCISRNGQHDGALPKLTADHGRVSGSLPRMALSRNFDGLVGGVVLQQSGDSGRCDRSCRLMTLENLKTGIGIGARCMCCGLHPLTCCQSLMKTRAIFFSHSDNVRQ